MDKMVKSVLLYCNPDSGEGAHSRKELKAAIRAAGYDCSVIPHKSDIPLEELANADLYAVAGGDGTVRKFMKQLMGRPLRYVRPIGLLPLGTANNIGKSLGVHGRKPDEVIAGWKEGRKQGFDVGAVTGLPREQYFLESMGFGIFPRLMRDMEALPEGSIQSPDDELDTAYRLLSGLVADYEASRCTIILDGDRHEGRYLMIAFMNIRSLGPNMQLAPDAAPGDDWLDVVLVTESERDVLARYFEEARKDHDVPFPVKAIRAREISVCWEGYDAHVDDKNIELPGGSVLTIRILPRLLHFLL